MLKYNTFSILQNALYMIIIHLYKDNAWPLKAAGKSCTDYAKMQTRVETQIQCQALCELENGCVGITYSHTHEDGQFCYVCYNTNAEKEASNGFHYYQMPGVKGTTMLLTS